MTSLTLPTLPTPLAWLHDPVAATTQNGALQFAAGPLTDWFNDPAGELAKGNAPVTLFSPPDATFRLSAQVTVDFAATYDAGVLFVYAAPDRWAKLCFELSPQGQPTVVSVVTRGVSDDCNSLTIDGKSVYLRVYRAGEVFAFHYSDDGRIWRLVRYFRLEQGELARIGFSVQSPVGAGCRARFDAIEYQAGPLSDLRSGA